jgi:hypothetical protein
MRITETDKKNWPQWDNSHRDRFSPLHICLYILTHADSVYILAVFLFILSEAAGGLLFL